MNIIGTLFKFGMIRYLCKISAASNARKSKNNPTRTKKSSQIVQCNNVFYSKSSSLSKMYAPPTALRLIPQEYVAIELGCYVKK